MKTRILRSTALFAVLLLLFAGCSPETETVVQPPQSDTATTDRIAALETQLSALGQTIERLTAATGAADAELREALEKQQQELTDSRTALQEQLAALLQQYEALKKQQEEEARQNEALRAQYEALKAECTQRQQALEALNRQLAALEEQLRQLPDAAAYEALAAQIAAVKGEIETVSGQLNAATAQMEAIAERLGKTETALQTLTGQIGTVAGQLETVDARLAENDAKLASHAEQIGALNQTLMGFQTQLDALQGALDGKVDQALYDSFVTETNNHILYALTALSALQNLCAGFDGATTVKSYIDAAVSAVTGQLGSYALQETYEAFYAEYGAFRTGIETRMAATESNIELLKELIEQLDGIEGEIGDLLALQTKVAQLEAQLTQLGDLNALFTKENQSFRDGVNGILADALAEDGWFDTALTERLEALQEAYTAAIEAANRRLDALEGRLDRLEEQMQELIGRIQSLVYVPKTSDGKIHIGTTYIAPTDETGAETGGRIEVTPTKKLEYRVSPADLRDGLLQLPLSAFSFYQEHVTRAEGESMDEFHIRKIEAGNGPGEILVTVDNDHDFTHEDLAVALCIRAESEHGILTEFTSPYTTVIGEGRNIRDRFYMARKTATGYEPSRDDQAFYLLRYDDTKSLVTLLGDYELIYDNGESCMSLDEARERFEWDIDLTMSYTGVEGAFTHSLRDATCTVTPSQPNSSRQLPVTVGFRSSDAGNEGHTLCDTYRIDLSDGEHTVTIIPEFRVSVIACAPSYTVERATVNWHYTTWRAVTGLSQGPATYTSQAPARIYSHKDLVYNYDLSYLPDPVLADLFEAGAEWTGTVPAAVQQKGLTVRTLSTEADGTHRTLRLAVDGFVYCEGMQLLQLTRTDVRPSCLAGSEGLRLTASVALTAPAARTISIAAETTTALHEFPLFYFSANPLVTASAAKRLAYTQTEINTHFGTTGNVDSFLAGGTLRSGDRVNPDWTAAGGATLPVSVTLLRTEDPQLIRPAMVISPAQLAAQMESGTSLTFPAPEGCVYTVPNGPTIPVSGSVTVARPAE